MAQEKATIILQLKDKASRGIKSLNERIKGFKVGIGTAALAVGGLVAALGASVRAFIKQENAVEKLNQSLKTQGIFTKETSKEIQDYAAELQKITTVGDEVIIEQQALLTSFGATGNELKNATKAALDLSAGLGIDLKAATLLVGKALAGDISTLSRYGIKIQEGLKESEKFAAVLEQINKKFGGAAQARLNTFSGRVENLQNRFGDLAEKVGKAVLPALEKFTSILEKTITFIEDAVTATEKLVSAGTQEKKGRELTILALEKQRDALIQIKNQRGELNEQERRRLELINESIGREGVLLMQERQREEERKIRLTEETESFNQAQENKTIKHKGAVGQQVKDAIKAAQARIAAEQRVIKVFSSGFDMVTARAGQSFADMITAGKSFSDGMKNIWKDLANYVISELARMIAKALVFKAIASSIGGPFGGFKQFGGGGAVNMQTGGMVRPRPGGVPAVIGEGGAPEMVLPLDDPRSINALKDAMSGGESIGGNVNVAFGDINVNVDRMSGTGEESEAIISEITESIRRETISGLRLALEIKNKSEQNENLAV